MEMEIIWFSLFVFLLLIEICTTTLVSIWFAIAALVCGFLAFFIDSVIIQTIIFIVVSLATLILTKKFVKKVRKKTIEPTNLDRVIGKEGTVTKTIKKDEVGEVKVLSNLWSAVSTKTIKEGSKVIIKEIEGVKLVVEKKEEEE